MKQLNFYILILVLLFSCKKTNLNSENNQINNQKNSEIAQNTNEKGVKFLTEFYTKYYGEYGDRKGIENYVSSRILNRMDSLSEEDNLILDYDPFINGQDYDWRTIKKTLEITPLKNKNEFRVSFLLFDEKNKKRTNIDLLLKEDKNRKFLIYSILNDEYLNFSNVKKAANYANVKQTNNNLISNKWYGVYEGSFLRMREESADPRGWATVDININKDSISIHLFSYIEERHFKLELLKEEKNILLFSMENNNTIKISNNDKNSYTLESSYIDNLIKEKMIITLNKK